MIQNIIQIQDVEDSIELLGTAATDTIATLFLTHPLFDELTERSLMTSEHPVKSLCAAATLSRLPMPTLRLMFTLILVANRLSLPSGRELMVLNLLAHESMVNASSSVSAPHVRKRCISEPVRAAVLKQFSMLETQVTTLPLYYHYHTCDYCSSMFHQLYSFGRCSL